MSFLFKSKKNASALPAATRNLTSAEGKASTASGYATPRDKLQQSPPVAGANPLPTRDAQPASPDQSAARDQPATRERRDTDPNQMTRNPAAPPPASAPAPAPATVRAPADTSLYPWSTQRFDFVSNQTNPFPRYGAAVNAVASKDGDIYLMGGLVNGSTVKGDLWIVEAGSGTLNCYPVATTAEGPGPRVGHASLLVGNAFIVFGGDTKIDDVDVLDDTLYLLNTSTKHWSRALPAGQRPAGRYGHTLNILGSKIYIFGGQVEGFFFNDLVAFDLNALQSPNNRWEMLIQNTLEGGPPQGQSPPARTNHTIVTWNDRLYLFGGTDGIHWFNDVWAYDPRTNSWTPQNCIGFIPAAREGHSAALVGDVMYIFGGRTEDGRDLGDLAAFRIPTRRWYTFHNMGPSPSPRSGHGMTALGDKVYVLAGEPSSAPRDPGELSISYVLDTSKIRYPNDQASFPGQRQPGSRRPSTGERSVSSQQDRPASRERQDSGTRSSLSQDPAQQDRLRQQAPTPTGRLNSMGSTVSNDGYQTGTRDSRHVTPTGNAPGRLDSMRSNISQDAFQQQSQAQRRDVVRSPSQSSLQTPVSPVQQGIAVQQRVVGGRPVHPTEASDSPRSLQNERVQTPVQMLQQAAASAPVMAGRSPYATNGQQPPRSESQTSMVQRPGSSNSITAPTLQGPAQATQQQSGVLAMQRQSSDTPSTAPRQNPFVQGQPQVARGQSPVVRGQSPVVRGQSPVVRGQSPVIRGQSPSIAQAQPSGPQPRYDGYVGERLTSAPSQADSMRSHRTQSSMDSTHRQGMVLDDHIDKLGHNVSSRDSRDSGVGSSPALSQQNDELLKELEFMRSRNAWYESELSLARKAGYRAGGEGALNDNENIPEDEKPLLEALIQMKTELDRVQNSLNTQSGTTAEKIAQIERERDAAVSEAVYTKTKSAARGDEARELADERLDTHRRLASTLASHDELTTRLKNLTMELENERKARQFAEESAEVAHNRASELDTKKQESASDLERLRSELAEAQKTAREASANHAEALSTSKLLQVDKDELTRSLAASQESAQTHSATLTALHAAVASSHEKHDVLDRHLGEEKGQRSAIEQQFAALRAEHETKSSELELARQRIQQLEEVNGAHAAEARSHREVVLAGLGKLQEPRLPDTSANDERIGVLQQRLDHANSMVRQNQAAADHAAERLRAAEERIAGLEQYQEQISREGLGMRKQLQTTSKESASLRLENTNLQETLSKHKLESAALSVQHGALKDILAERGADLSRARTTEASAAGRTRDLEQQLESSNRAHEDLRASFEAREQEANRGWEEKLARLDNDYQSAVKYLKGTEKMLSKMKQELHRYKSQNRELEEEAGRRAAREATEHDAERGALRSQLEQLQVQAAQTASQLQRRGDDLQALAAERDTYKAQLDRHAADAAQLRTSHAQLETRAAEAERKVQLLLESVGAQSHHGPGGGNGATGAQHPGLARVAAAGGASGHSRGLSAASIGADSMYSVEGGERGPESSEVISRNSMALDSLASELETLRSHWEKGRPLSEIEAGAGGGGAGAASAAASARVSENPAVSGELASWRRKLSMEEREGARGGLE